MRSQHLPPPSEQLPTIAISWSDKRLAQNLSTIQGNGVITTAPIFNGELVIVFGGYVISLDHLAEMECENPKAFAIVVDRAYQIADNLLFSPVHQSQFSVAEHLNHSCNPNCGFVSEIALVTMRDIDVGEELSIDYAMCVSHSMFEMECACGQLSCRGRLTAEDWMRPDLQSKYHGFFQPYLARKIIADSFSI